MNRSKEMSLGTKAAGIFGVFFIIAILAINLFIPNPTPTQQETFKIVLALAAAGVAGIFAGFLHVQSKWKKFSIRAGGALAVFVVVFMINPATLLSKPTSIKPIAVDQTLNGRNGTQIGVNNGTMNIENSSTSKPSTNK
ncbi:hypothetical protein ACO0LD_10430 [Undibacterium sp. Ji83W]|uniref:hypothetical protein n=1 Tax=Undibacterium sp. Ji83W TaxID=3413043 RepID=UPI003BF3D4B7